MSAEQSFQPQISKLDLVSIEAKLADSKRVEVVFKVAYEVRWPRPSVQQWRLDLGLFDVESTEELEEDLGELGIASPNEWRQTYLEVGDKGHRSFGETGAVSVMLESAFAPWSLNKAFGAIKLFIAEHSMKAVTACNITVNNLVFQTIPDNFIEQIIGDGWTFSDYQSDKKKWWKKWRLELEGASGIVKTGTVTLGIPLEQLEAQGSEIAFYDPELGWQIIDEDHNFRVLGRLVEVRPQPVTAWSNTM